MATVTPISYTAGANEVNNLTLTADADWLTYNEAVPHQTAYLGAFNPDFLKSLKVSFTGNENNHLTKVIITGDVTGTADGPIEGGLEGPIALVVSTVLGVGTAEGPFAGVFEGALEAAVEAGFTGTGTFVLGEPSPDATDATSQVDIEWSLLDAIRRLPDGTAIVPLSAASVGQILLIPTTIAGQYEAKALLVSRQVLIFG